MLLTEKFRMKSVRLLKNRTETNIGVNISKIRFVSNE